MSIVRDGANNGHPKTPVDGSDDLQTATVVTKTLANVAPFDGPLSPGVVVGRYRVLERVGSGGMGVIYKAYDPELDRQVALKLLRIGGSGNDVDSDARARLLREAQALAKLSHANVVAVHDVGLVGDRVFVAMEYVQGQTVKTWLREKPRSQQEILSVFLAAGRGLVAAHAAGLVHRDFKPDNVIVGDDGSVRVLDFGLARAAKASDSKMGDAPESEDDVGSTATGQTFKSDITEAGQVLGTPPYMAPEQHMAAEITVATDQFSYCVSLYEALYGERPFTGRNRTELRRAITLGKLREPTRGTDVPAWLRRVVVRGLKVASEDRHPSMAALLGELANDPRTRRRRVAAIATGAVVVGALAWSLGSAVSAEPQILCQGSKDRVAGVWDAPIKAKIRRAFADAGLANSEGVYVHFEQAIDSYLAGWVTARTETCEATHVRGEQSEALLDVRMACLDRRLNKVAALVSEYSDRPSRDGVRRAVEGAYDLASVSGCANVAVLSQIVPLPESPQAKKRIASVRKKLDQAEAKLLAGAYDDGLKLVLANKGQVDDINYAPLSGETLSLLAELHLKTGAHKESEADLYQAATAATAARDDFRLAEIWTKLVFVVGWEQSRHDAARAFGVVAEQAVARAGGDPGLHADLLSSLGKVMFAQGQAKEAEAHQKRAIALRKKTLGADHPATAAAMAALGNVYHSQGKHEQARAVFERVIAIRKKAYGPDHPEVAAVRNGLGLALFGLGKFVEAKEQHEQALAVEERVFSSDHARLAVSLHNLGNTLERLKQYQKAKDCFARAVEIRTREFGPNHPHVAVPVHGMGDMFFSLKQYEKAAEHYQRALAIFEKALGPKHPFVAYSRTGLGRAYLRLGKHKEAVAALEPALAIRESGQADPVGLAETRSALARALWASKGDRKRALRLANKAREALLGAGESAKDELAVLDTWLAAIHR